MGSKPLSPLPNTLMYTAKVIDKQNDSGYSRIAIEFSNSTDSITEWIDCDFPVNDKWLERKCAKRINELQGKKNAISAIQLKKVSAPPNDLDPSPSEPTELDIFLQALRALRSSKNGNDLGIVSDADLATARLGVSKLYKPEYLLYL